MKKSKNAGFAFVMLSSFLAAILLDPASASRCEKISSSMCMNLKYNSTLMPNFMGQDNQKDADVELLQYKPFLNHKCSKHLRLFICSVHVPFCSEHLEAPVKPCKELCERVKSDCLEALTILGYEWPQKLNCTRFPESPGLCMGPPEEPESTTNDLVQKGNYLGEIGSNFNGLKCPPNTTPLDNKCVPLCKQNQPLQRPEEANYEVWVAVWSIVCLTFTIFALITFVIQPKRFRWPARPILYLTFCGFVTCTIYLIRWIEGPYTCTGVSLLEKPAESLSCVGISLILLFCDVAYTLWWCVFCFVWFLSAMKEWSTEAIEKISTRLHATVWVFSAIPMFYVLSSNNITINYLSGFCEIKTATLALFQLFFVAVSCVLGVLMLIALRNVRIALVLAGRSPEKLERLFYRLLIISIGVCVPHILYLVCQFYDAFSTALPKLVLRKISIIFATLWVYSPKTFEMWWDLLCFCKTDKTLKKDSSAFMSFIPKIFRKSDSTDVPKVGGNNTPLVMRNKNDERLYLFGLFLNRNSAQLGPVTRV